MIKKLMTSLIFFGSIQSFAQPFEFEVHSGQVCKNGPERTQKLERHIAAYPDKVVVYTETTRIGPNVEIVAVTIVKKPVRIEDVVGTSDTICARIVAQPKP